LHVGAQKLRVYRLCQIAAQICAVQEYLLRVPLNMPGYIYDFCVGTQPEKLCCRIHPGYFIIPFNIHKNSVVSFAAVN
jgi:hypothetical protein